MPWRGAVAGCHGRVSFLGAIVGVPLLGAMEGAIVGALSGCNGGVIGLLLLGDCWVFMVVWHGGVACCGGRDSALTHGGVLAKYR